jgi:hypothetical protein
MLVAALPAPAPSATAVSLPAVRALLALGGLVIAVGIGVLVWAVRQEVALASCVRPCGSAPQWPVAIGVLVLLGGLFLIVWSVANSYAGRALHPARHELEERERLRRVGVQGTARVLGSEEAGVSRTGEPLVAIDLAVTVPGREPYEVHHRAPVPRWLSWRLRVRRPLPVLVDPEDPERLLVEWGRLTTRSTTR